MALTRANVEFLLEARVGPLLTSAGMATTVTGVNVDLNGPIGRAIRQLGHAVASAVLVADADVALVTDAETDEFLGYAELYTLEAILGNLSSPSLSQLAKQVERKIDRLRASLEREYGYGLAVPEAGYIQVDIAEHD